MMKVRLVMGDMVFTEYDIPDGSRTSNNIAMTLATEYGMILATEFEKVIEDGDLHIYAMTHAFNMKPQHVSTLDNLKKDLGDNASEA
jgi:hypothetical protein